MKEKAPFALLQTLINAYGPCGQEDQVRELCHKLITPLTDELWTDPAGNLIGKIKGRDPKAPALRVMAHMDEIAMIVKRINDDGSLRVNPLGGSYPGSFGQGPVDILGTASTIPGILSFGSMHTTKESKETHHIMPKEYSGEGSAPFWESVHVTTRLSPKALAQAGVHPGSRVVIARTRRQLFEIEDCIAGYFFDNRAAIAIAIETLQELKKAKKTLKNDLFVIFSVAEEIGGHGACYAARTLPGDITIALDVGPVAKEYQTLMSPDPIIVYQDGMATYDKSTCDHLFELGKKLKFTPQRAVFSTYGSDASIARSLGQSAKATLLCLPVENTHGYEIAHKESFNRCAQLLTAYLLDPL